MMNLDDRHRCLQIGMLLLHLQQEMMIVEIMIVKLEYFTNKIKYLLKRMASAKSSTVKSEKKNS